MNVTWMASLWTQYVWDSLRRTGQPTSSTSRLTDKHGLKKDHDTSAKWWCHSLPTVPCKMPHAYWHLFTAIHHNTRGLLCFDVASKTVHFDDRLKINAPKEVILVIKNMLLRGQDPSDYQLTRSQRETFHQTRKLVMQPHCQNFLPTK